MARSPGSRSGQIKVLFFLGSLAVVVIAVAILYSPRDREGTAVRSREGPTPSGQINPDEPSIPPVAVKDPSRPLMDPPASTEPPPLEPATLIPSQPTPQAAQLLSGPSEIRPDAQGHEIINAFFGLTEDPMTQAEFDELIRRAKGGE